MSDSQPTLEQRVLSLEETIRKWFQEKHRIPVPLDREAKEPSAPRPLSRLERIEEVFRRIPPFACKFSTVEALCPEFTTGEVRNALWYLAKNERLRIDPGYLINIAYDGDEQSALKTWKVMFSERLNELMIKWGYGVEDLARLSGYSIDMVELCLSSEYSPPHKVRLQLSRVFGFMVDVFAAEEDEEA